MSLLEIEVPTNYPTRFLANLLKYLRKLTISYTTYHVEI